MEESSGRAGGRPAQPRCPLGDALVRRGQRQTHVLREVLTVEVSGPGEDAEIGGIYNMGGACVASYVSILEAIR